MKETNSIYFRLELKEIEWKRSVSLVIVIFYLFVKVLIESQLFVIPI